MKRINALTIAGTDPSGGAGIQADLKAFSALGAYGTSVITALVAQNTRGVQSVYYIDPAFVAAQLDSVFSDVRIDSVKIGMLAQRRHRAGGGRTAAPLPAGVRGAGHRDAGEKRRSVAGAGGGGVYPARAVAAGIDHYAEPAGSGGAAGVRAGGR